MFLQRPFFPFRFFISLDDFLDQRVTNDILLVEMNKGDILDPFQKLPGFYQAGRDSNENPHQDLTDFDNVDPDNPPITGCTRCGWQTSFLQLVLRPMT